MNESTWHPQPGDRVLIRNAGEYGWRADEQAALFVWPGLRYELVNVYSSGMESPSGSATVLRSDLSPIEPPRPPVPSLEWFDPDNYPEPKDIAPLVAMGLRSCPTCARPFERHTGPETEETRRLTREDYSDIERTRKDVLLDEMLDGLIGELIEAVDPKLLDAWRARTRKEGR